MDRQRTDQFMGEVVDSSRNYHNRKTPIVPADYK